MAKTTKLLPPVHPGEILLKDFMKPLRLTVNKRAIDLHVPATRIGEIVHQRRRTTADTALRLAHFCKSHPEFWLNLQPFYELELTPRSGIVSDILSAMSTQPRSWFLNSALPEKLAEIAILSRSSFTGLRNLAQLAGEN